MCTKPSTTLHKLQFYMHISTKQTTKLRFANTMTYLVITLAPSPNPTDLNQYNLAVCMQFKIPT